jgi:hypothetical protein
VNPPPNRKASGSRGMICPLPVAGKVTLSADRCEAQTTAAP